MVVDDHMFTTKLIADVLRVLGARDIRTFQDADKAWKDMCYRPPDLLLVDWNMSPVDGIALTRRIRNDGDSPNIYMPIIMVTGFREMENVFTARDAGVNEYVIKPVSPKALFSRIQMVIEKPRRFVRVGDFFGPDRRRTAKENAQGYDGAMRREGEMEEAALVAADAEAARKRDMTQDEINATFNPDTQPPPGP